MLTQNEANVLLEYMDRVAITGHRERVNMNIVVDKLAKIADPKPEEPKKKETKGKK